MSRRRVGASLAAAVGAALVALAVRGVALHRAPGSDEAAIMLVARGVLSGALRGTGMPSTAASGAGQLYHPGPLEFLYLAPGTWFGFRALPGMMVALNACWIAAAAHVLHRRFGRTGDALAIVTSLILLMSPRDLLSVWNPDVVRAPAVTLAAGLCVVLSPGEHRSRSAPVITVAAASWCAQAHLSALAPGLSAIAVVVTLAALAGFRSTDGPTGARVRAAARYAGPGLLTAALLWAPLTFDGLAGARNLGRLLTSGGTGDPRLGWWRAGGALQCAVSPGVLFGGRSPCVVSTLPLPWFPVALIAGAVLLGRFGGARPREVVRFTAPVTIGLWACTALLPATTSSVERRSLLLAAGVLAVTAIATFAGAAAVVVSATESWVRLARSWVVVPRLVAVCAIALVVVVPLERTVDVQRRAAREALISGVPDGAGTVALTSDGVGFLESPAPALVLDLRDRGVDARIEGFTTILAPEFTVTGAPPDRRALRVHTGPGAADTAGALAVYRPDGPPAPHRDVAAAVPTAQLTGRVEGLNADEVDAVLVAGSEAALLRDP